MLISDEHFLLFYLMQIKCLQAHLLYGSVDLGDYTRSEDRLSTSQVRRYMDDDASGKAKMPSGVDADGYSVNDNH